MGQTFSAGFRQKRHFRSIFLSDIHLGSRGCQAERLLAFLKQHSCDRLYLAGDIVDGWQMRSSVFWPQAHNDVLRRFLTLAKRGAEVIWVTGNHDEFLRRYSPLSLGNIHLVDRAVHQTADGRELLVIHGDEFDVITRYHRSIAILGDLGYTALLHLNRWVNAARARFGFGHWSLSAWVKYRVKQAVSFIGEFEEAVARHCEDQGYAGVICGHIHHAEIRSLGSVEYLNCGDWVESCTALVEHLDGTFEILRWQGQALPVTPVRTLEKAA